MPIGPYVTPQVPSASLVCNTTTLVERAMAAELAPNLLVVLDLLVDDTPVKRGETDPVERWAADRVVARLQTLEAPEGLINEVRVLIGLRFPVKQSFFFEHVPQGSIGLDLEYDQEVMAWDFEARAWVKRSGCRRFNGPDVGVRVREAVDALRVEGSVLVVWDAFPWMVGLMWDANPSLWAAMGKTEMVGSECVWPELRDEFFGWLPGRP